MGNIERVRSLIEAGRIDAVEDLWLEAQAERPGDLDFFGRIAGLLVKTKENDTAIFLLELLDEQLSETCQWAERLALLQQCGLLYLEPAQIHAEALVTLERIYPDSSSLDGLIAKTGLQRAIEDTPKTWTKIARLRSLMQFERDAYVWMKDKGAGRVVEVNLELESFKIELTDRSDLRVGFAAAAKMLQPLSTSHIERRKLEDMEALLKLKDEDPGELLILALQSRDRPLTAAEIRKALAGVVEDSEWNSWWAGARKHSRVLNATTKGRQTYTWADTEDRALEDVRRNFLRADVEGKLEILRQNAMRSKELSKEMLEELRTIAEAQLDEEPAIALSIWYAMEKLGATNELSWSPSTIATKAAVPVDLAQTLTDKSLRDRFYDLCWSVRSDGESVFRDALAKEDDPRLLTKLAERLGTQNPVELKTVVDDILGHSRRRPAAFVWLAESGESLASLEGRNPLRLIRQILDALHQSEFSRYKSRLHKTFETGGGATHLFTRLSEDQAAQAEQAVQSAPLDEHLRDSLIRYLHVRYPALDSSRESQLYASETSIKARRQELEKLQTEEIPANRKAIEEARELGDLRENFEYKSARQRHEYLNARLASLKRDLARVRPLTSQGVDFSEARVVCRLDLDSTSGSRRSITILGPWESDPGRDIVSYDSDLGQALLGKRSGDTVGIDGETWTLTGISPWK